MNLDQEQIINYYRDRNMSYQQKISKDETMTHGGARSNAGRIKHISFKPTKDHSIFLDKWESLGYKSKDDLINFCIAVISKSLR